MERQVGVCDPVDQRTGLAALAVQEGQCKLVLVGADDQLALCVLDLAIIDRYTRVGAPRELLGIVLGVGREAPMAIEDQRSCLWRQSPP